MIVPVGAESFPDALRMGAEIYHFLKKLLQKEGKLTAVGDEGGFAPDFSSAGEVFACLQRAVEEAGYKVGSDVAFAMDAAASELYSEEDGMYHFPGEAQIHEEVDVNLRRPDTQGGAYTSDTHVKTQETTIYDIHHRHRPFFCIRSSQITVQRHIQCCRCAARTG